MMVATMTAIVLDANGLEKLIAFYNIDAACSYACPRTGIREERSGGARPRA